MWTFWICEAFTGEKRMQVYPSGGDWRTVANGVGSGTHTFQLNDPDGPVLSRADRREIFRPWANYLVVCFLGIPIYAAFVISARSSSRQGVLIVKHSELRLIMKGRYAYTIHEHAQTNEFTVAMRSLRGIARAVAYQGLSRDMGGNWQLPVVFGADEAGDETRTWYAYRFQSTEQMLAEIQNSDGGPDVHFQPRWNSSDALEFELRLGAPRLTGPVLEVNAMAEDGGVLDVGELWDGAQQVTGIWAQGEGSEVDMRLGRAGDEAGIPPGHRIPNIDLPRPFKTISDVAQLNKSARAEWTANRKPTTQIDLDVLAEIALPATRIGSTARVWIRNDAWMLDGWHEGYIVAMSGRMGDDALGLEFQ